VKIFYCAEIVGKAGILAFKKGLPLIREAYNPDFVVAGADGVTHGSGLGRDHAGYLRKLGANALTLGECAFYKKDLTENITKVPYALRPANLVSTAPGYGARVYKTEKGEKVAVAVLLGQANFSRTHSENPYAALGPLLERLRAETPYCILDFHAEASAEKRGLFAAADGLCSAVIGSHTRVQTADEEIMSGGTACITDAGRTGSRDSVGGCEVQSRVNEYLTGIPDWTRDAFDAPCLQGVVVDIGADGKALSIERVNREITEEKQCV
jgi:metallophosphoesterase (TIGR00282 family)